MPAPVLVRHPHACPRVGSRALRSGGVLDVICGLISSDDEAAHQNALMLLANFTTSAVDPACELTRRRLKANGAFGRLVPRLFSESALTVSYACGSRVHVARRPRVNTFFTKLRSS